MGVNNVFQGRFVVISFPDFMKKSKFLIMQGVKNIFEIPFDLFKGNNGPAHIDKSFLKDFGHIELVRFMVVIVKLKLFLLVDSTFEKLTVDLIFGFYFI